MSRQKENAMATVYVAKCHDVNFYNMFETTPISAPARTETPPQSPPLADSLAPTVPAPPRSPSPSRSFLESLSPEEKNIFVSDLKESLLKYFKNSKKTTTINETIVTKDGELVDVPKVVPLPPPQPSIFCREHNISMRDLRSLAKEYPELRDAIEDCLLIYKEFIVENGLLGLYNPKFAQFIANTELKMVEFLGVLKVIHEDAPSEVHLKGRRKKVVKTFLDNLETPDEEV